MPSIPNLSIRSIYDNAADFLAYYTPTWSFPSSPNLSASNSPTVTKAPGPDTALRDCVTLRQRLEAACDSPTSSLASLPSSSMRSSSMRRELDLTKIELTKSRSDAQRLDERCKILERTLKETRDMLRFRDLELEKLRKAREKERLMAERRHSDVGPLYKSPSVPKEIQPRHSSLDMRITTTEITLNGFSSNGHINPHTNPHSSGFTDHGRSLALAPSEEERARIRGDEIYTTRTDSWSGAQVLQAVHDINSEILQFAASATELCTFDRDSRPSSSRSVQAMHDISSRLGPNLSRILSNRDHSQDPILVQLALQGCVSLCIIRALASFCVGFSAKADAVLSQVYSKMVLAEPQPTSSKWRALTHRHIHASYPNLAENTVSDLSDTILRWSADIFIIAGCSSYETAATSSKDGLKLRFGDQVRRIAKAATRLAQVTREEIMSTCFDVTAANQNDVFDSSRMSDAFGDYVASRGAIIATTELGLRCTTRVQNIEQFDTSDEVVLHQRVILQPKVVLESVLDVLDPR